MWVKRRLKTFFTWVRTCLKEFETGWKFPSEIKCHLLGLWEESSKYSHPTPNYFLCSKHLLHTDSNVYEKLCKINLSNWWMILKHSKWVSVSWCSRWPRRVLSCWTERAGNVLTLSVNYFNVIHSVHCDWISDL